MTNDPFQILVVDDERNIRDLLKQFAESAGCKVETAGDSESAFALARSNAFDLIFLDIRMPGLNGVEVLKQLQLIQKDASYVMITGCAGSDLVDESLSNGAFVCLSKPFGISQVIDIIKTLCDEKKETVVMAEG